MPIVPVTAPWSHDLAGIPPACRSGSPAAVRLRERCRADAEALEGTQQAEAGVLGFAIRVDDVGELAGERQLPPHSPQAAGVLGVLMGDGKAEFQAESESNHEH